MLSGNNISFYLFIVSLPAAIYCRKNEIEVDNKYYKVVILTYCSQSPLFALFGMLFEGVRENCQLHLCLRLTLALNLNPSPTRHNSADGSKLT